MPEPHLVVGGSIAALVAADALGRAGRSVRLVLPAKGVGGGFRAMRRDGRRLELGVRVLELGYEDDAAAPSLDRYRPGFGGHRPYTRLVREWVEELAGERLVDVPRPRMVVGGDVHDDIYFTVDLRELPQILGPARTADVRREAQEATARLGDAGVLPALNGHSLAEASLANHGPTLHRTLIAPVADKFLADGAERTLAAWRRKVWMPLFWPRTVAEACTGAPTFSPARRFETIAGDGPGALVDALLTRLHENPLVETTTAGPLRAVRHDGHAVTVDVEGAGSLTAQRPVLGTGARELFAAVGAPYAPERARSVLAWVETTTEPVPVTHVVDPDNPVVRVSDSGPGVTTGTRVLCVELRHDLPTGDIDAAVRAGLCDAGLFAPDTPAEVVFRGAMDTFDAPTRATRDAHAAALADLDAAGLDAIVVGGAAAPGADSFNEQVVAGLAAAEALA
jgi:hypothetical protein